MSDWAERQADMRREAHAEEAARRQANTRMYRGADVDLGPRDYRTYDNATLRRLLRTEAQYMTAGDLAAVRAEMARRGLK